MSGGDDAPASNPAWAVTSSWRGDLKLFARIAEKASQAVGEAGQPKNCQVQFAVRHDLETYHSVEDLLERAPASTLRSFNSARIQVGEPGLRVEVRFGRKKAHSEAELDFQKGVSVQVSSDGAVTAETVARVRDAISVVVARGGFSWADLPTAGPSGSHEDREAAQTERWRRRQGSAQAVFASVTILALLFAYVVFVLVTAEDGGKAGSDGDLPDPLSAGSFAIGVLLFAQGVSAPISTFLFPAIEIADVTPGRRIFQVVSRSGVVTAAVGVVGAYVRGKV